MQSQVPELGIYVVCAPVTGTVEHRSWDGASVLVTGAGGFIGSHLVEYLVRQGARVRAFVRYNSRSDFGRLEDISPDVLAEVDVFLGDLTNPEAAYGAMAEVDAVLHLGALIPIPYSYTHPREFVQANVEGAMNMLEAARRREVSRLVHVSSSEVYGTAQTVPIREDHPLGAQSPYAATKIGADQLALSFWRSFETPVVVARPFNTYGPRQSARAVIPTIITQALGLGVVRLGSTSPTRDFLYVEDTARGIAACGSAVGVEGEVLNLGTGTEYSVRDVAMRIFEQIGEDIELVSEDARVRPSGSEVERLLADSSRARELLGWQSEVTLDVGLERTVAWIRKSLATYKTDRYVV
jgi:NAD dependent epimerase/dehydratase